MTDPSVSRRLFLSSAAAAPVLAVSDRVVEFIPPPERVRIVTAATSFVVPPPQYSAQEIQQIVSQGKSVQMTVATSADELDRLLPDVDVIF